MNSRHGMNGAEFDLLAPFLKMTRARLAAARAVLVDGATLKDAGVRFGWSYQAVQQAVRQVEVQRARFLAIQQAQRGIDADRAASSLHGHACAKAWRAWSEVTFIAPTDGLHALVARIHASGGRIVGTRTDTDQTDETSPNGALS